MGIFDSFKVKNLINDLESNVVGVHMDAVEALAEMGNPAVKPLIKALKNEKRRGRAYAAEALGQIGDERAVGPLIQALKDVDVRWKAAVALGNIGDKRAVEPLIPILKDENEYIRQNVAEALEKMGWQPKDDLERAYYLTAKEEWGELVEIGESAVEPLIQALNAGRHFAIQDEIEDVRSRAAKALGEIGSERAVEPLIQALKDEESRWVQGDVAEALGQIGEPAVEPLIQALNNEIEDVRSRAAKALGEIGDTRAVEPLIHALKDEDEDVRARAAEALGKVGDERVVELLIQALKDEGSIVRLNAAKALGKLGDERAVEPLIQVLNDDSYIVRDFAEEALEKIGEPAVEPLIRALKDEDGIVRLKAAKVLGKVGDERAVEPFIQALKDEDEDVRARAAEALGKIGDERSVEPLIQALNDKDEDVQQKATEALEKMGWQPKDGIERAYYLISKQELDKLVNIGKPAVEPLIQTLKDGSWKAQQFAAEAIVKIGEPAVEPLIQAVKKDNDKNLRWKTAESIVKMMGEPAVEPLTRMLKDKDKLVREKSKGALEEIKDAIAIEPIFLSGIEELDELLATGEQDELAKENAEFMKILKGFAELLNHEDSDVQSAAAYAFRLIARTLDEKHLSCEPLYKYTLLLKEVEEKGEGGYGYDADEHAGVALDYIGRYNNHTWLKL